VRNGGLGMGEITKGMVSTLLAYAASQLKMGAMVMSVVDLRARYVNEWQKDNQRKFGVASEWAAKFEEVNKKGMAGAIWTDDLSALKHKDVHKEPVLWEQMKNAIGSTVLEEKKMKDLTDDQRLEKQRKAEEKKKAFFQGFAEL